MQPSVLTQCLHYVSEHLPFYTEGLAALSTQTGNAPRGSTRQYLQETVCAQLQQRGMTTHLLGADIPVIYGELLTNSPHTILFYNYYDSRTTIASGWGIVLSLLAAIDAYRATQPRLPVNIKWLIDLADEQGFPALPLLSSSELSLLQADSCLCLSNEPTADGRLQLALGTHGLLTVELESVTSSQEIPSMHGSIVPNALWRLLWAITSLKNSYEDILIDGFYDTLLPPDDEASRLLELLPDRTQSLIHHWQIPHLLMNLQGRFLRYTHVCVPTCTVQKVLTDVSPTPSPHMIIPPRASAIVDFHLVPDQDPDNIFGKLQDHLSAHGLSDIKSTLLYGCKPYMTPRSAPFLQLVLQAAKDAYVPAPFLLPSTVRSLPAVFLTQSLGLPVVFVVTDDATPPTTVTIKDLLEPVNLLVLVLDKMSSTLAT